LGISITIVGALLAASTGIVGATVVTMGLISLPTMLKRGYSPSFAAGSIAAAGTLGQIIPPSIVLVLLGDVMSSAYQQAQRDMGIFSPEPMSVGDLFAGAFLPGLMLVGLYVLYQVAVAFFKPELCPAYEEDETDTQGLLPLIMKAMLPPLVLIISVLGSILSGIATPTEAAAVGAVGAILLGSLRLSDKAPKSVLYALFSLAGLVILTRTGLTGSLYLGLAIVLVALVIFGIIQALKVVHKTGVLRQVMDSTVKISTMIFVILIGAALFSLVFRGLGGDDYVADILAGLPGGKWGALVAVMVVMFVLGFFLDFIEITFVVVPIVAPILLAMGLDPVWLGIMIALNLQT
ncbi:MAG: TRAP transporter large permease subunit, partial [Sphingomonadales bacterium]|nr:TRAP transporter large permease subunit [Sphingomonadales bacterium]